jgi:hypothetical protein
VGLQAEPGQTRRRVRDHVKATAGLWEEAGRWEGEVGRGMAKQE